MIKKNKVSFLIILIIVCFSLGYSLFSLNKQIVILKAENNNLQQYYSKNGIMNMRVSEDFFNEINNDDELALIIFLGDYGCFSCKTSFVKNINKMSKSFSDKIQIFFLGNNHDQIKNLNLTVNYKISYNINTLFDDKINISEPFAFIVDKNRNVLLNFTADPKYPDRNEHFFNVASYLLENVN